MRPDPRQDDNQRMEALSLMTRALQAAKSAKSRGADVKAARGLMRECLRAFQAGAYAETIRLAEDVVRRFEGFAQASR